MRTNRFSSFFLRPYLIAGVLAVTLYLIIPTAANKYKLILDEVAETSIDEMLHMEDLNHDGLPEVVLASASASDQRIALVVKTMQNKVSEQYNVENCFSFYSKKVFIDDLNEDGYQEMIVPFIREGKMAIKVFCYGHEEFSLHEQEFVIDSLDTDDITPDKFEISDIRSVRFSDKDHKELLFIVFGKYQFYQHRFLVRLDLITGELIRSAKYCNMISSLELFDRDYDTRFEITGKMGSPDNAEGNPDCKYPDHQLYYMVFDQQLNLINDPNVFEGGTSVLYCFNLGTLNQPLLIWVHLNGGVSDRPDLIYKLKQNGQFEGLDTLHQYGSKWGEACLLVRGQSGRVIAGFHHNNPSIKIIDVNGILTSIETNIYPDKVFAIDIDNDEADELLVFQRDVSQLSVYNLDGVLLTNLVIPNICGENINKVGRILHEGVQKTFIHIGTKVWFVDWRFNSYYYWRWALLVPFWIFFFLLYQFISWIQRKQIRDREELEVNLRKLQLQSIKNQLNPHFTFNALNVLSYLAREGDVDRIDHFIQHFSKLLRNQVESGSKTYTTLYEEVRFCEHYIELQKLRFDIPIHFDLDVESGVNMNLHIPKMMIHTHVENAIKHGLIPAEGGKVCLRIRPSNGNTVIEIENNGTPRNESNGQQTESTGKGLAILDQLYELFEQLYKVKITQTITDLKTKSNTPTGTKVTIIL